MTDQIPKTTHSLLDDVQGISLGVFLAGISVHLLTTVGLITGQTAGIAVIISYLSGYSFGLVFFLVNIPFYVLAWKRLGKMFTIKSLISVTLLSILTTIIPLGMVFTYIDPLLGALTCGALTGVALLVLFRHNGSLGGLGVVALLIQDTTGFRAGWVQLIFDACLFGLAFFIFDTAIVIYSLIGAVTLNLIIAFNHRRDRYIAT
ncbi:YitT family protein [bacterium]|uniref:YitT family protein n=1 Tax=Yoonia sp. TaxID=2212373 RepID=UPI00237424A7|nr:YitT family protein [Yoonia sp.]MDB4245914.1 YitT family protein [bacterium]